jgi:spore coat polysaccharide biosynthesis protein SpsF
MKSARMPGKVLAPIEVAGETHPMLWYQVQRLRKSKAEVVIATTEDASDDPIAALARDMKMRCVRGSTSDLIARHAKVARETDADVLVLSGADDPFLQAPLVDAVADLVSDEFPYAESIGFPLGMNCWAWTADAMEEADRESLNSDEREHVVPWFARRPLRYPKTTVTIEPSLYESHRLTVDFPQDLELVRRILGVLWPENPDFRLDDILRVLEAFPDWLSLNRGAPQYFYDRTALDAVHSWASLKGDL